MMAIFGISTVRNVLNPPNLEKAAEEMQKAPEAAATAFGDLLKCITNEAHELGIGFTGEDPLIARSRLQQIAGPGKGFTETAVASKSQLMEVLQYMRPLGNSFSKQMEMPSADPRRVELLQKMFRMTEDLQRFRAPTKPSDP